MDSLKTNLRDKKPDPIWIQLVLVLSSFSYGLKVKVVKAITYLFR